MAFRWSRKRYARHAPDARRRLSDHVFQTYFDWREAAADVSDTYARWVHAPPEEVKRWFATYQLALDQEGAAASAYATALAHGERQLSGAVEGR
jgi:hypothetical protein